MSARKHQTFFGMEQIKIDKSHLYQRYNPNYKPENVKSIQNHGEK